MLSEQILKPRGNIPGKANSKLQKPWIFQEHPSLRADQEMHLQEITMQKEIL
jgi:hypothetical protein